MKHVCLMALAFVLNATIYAQNVPNGGFENWTLQVVYEDPENWITLNMLGALGAPATVVQSTDAHTGNYAALLETVETDMGGDGIADTLPGTMTLGLFDISGETPSGAPVSGTPDTLAGWFKFLPQGNDGFGLAVTMSRWNTATQSREIVGYGDFMNTAEFSQYARVAIPIEYYTEDAPDTVEIQILNSIGTTTPGTQLFVDDLTLKEMSTASISTPDVFSVSCFPNPADAMLTINSPVGGEAALLTITGEQLETIQLTPGSSLQLNTSDYQNGVYFVRHANGKNTRFVIQH